MTRTALLLLVGMTAAFVDGTASAAQRVSWYGGVENYSWREYDNTGARILEESGPRYFLGLSGTNYLDPQWQLTFDMRFYMASVNYDGQTNQTPPKPLSTRTDYHGMSAELSAIRFLGAINNPVRFGIVGALGADAWRRHINSTSTASGYTETYHIGYARLGLALVVPNSWRVMGGIKYPFSTDEQVGLSTVGYDNVQLAPTPAISAFISARGRMSLHWWIIAYYDSYRFDKSPAKALTSGGIPAGTVWQPAVEQERYGLSFSYRY